MSAPTPASSTPSSTTAWQLGLGLGGLLAAIALAMTLVPAVQAAAAPAPGETQAVASMQAAFQGLQVFTNGPLSAAQP